MAEEKSTDRKQIPAFLYDLWVTRPGWPSSRTEVDQAETIRLSMPQHQVSVYLSDNLLSVTVNQAEVCRIAIGRPG